jgi:hypothetical protein
MTKVTIVAENPGSTDAVFRASARQHQSVGPTAGAALDALTAQLDDAETGTLIVVQNLRPDEFFTLAQQQRLEGLLDKWRTARAGGHPLSAEERAELTSLVDAELEGATQRSAATAL